MLFDGQQVRQDLSRVIHVGQSVPDRNAGILGQIFNDLLIISSVFNTVIESAQNLSSVFQGFLLAHL